MSLKASKRVGLGRMSRLMRPFSSATSALDRSTDVLSGLTDDQQQLREMVRDFALRELAPRAEAIDRENEFPMV